MKLYVLAIVTHAGVVVRKRVFKNVVDMREYYCDLFDMSTKCEKGFPSKTSDVIYLNWEYIHLVERKDI